VAAPSATRHKGGNTDSKDQICFGRNLAGSEEGQLTRAMRTGPTSIKTLPVPMRVHIHHGVPLPKVAAIEKRKCSGQTMSSCAGARVPPYPKL